MKWKIVHAVNFVWKAVEPMTGYLVAKLVRKLERDKRPNKKTGGETGPIPHGPIMGGES